MRSAPRRLRPASRHEGLVFNLLCGAYFLLVSPHVVEVARRGMEPAANRSGPALWLGVLLLLASLLEVRALPEKLRFVHFAIRDRKPGDGGSIALFFLWMFHAVISVLVVVLAAREFGADVDTRDGTPDFPMWLSALMPVVVIKELYLLITIWGPGRELPASRYARPRSAERFHDAVLIAYACLAYSVTWGMVSENALGGSNPMETAVNTLAASLLFLMFYLPMRIPYLLEEWSFLETRADRLRFAASLLTAMIPAVWPLA